MQIFKEKEALAQEVERLKSEGKTIGFVPTMGALHEGHLSLVKQAITACDAVIVSIFVNPTQFNDAADLEKYPRTLPTDLELLKKLDFPLIIFAPNAANVYGDKVKAEKFDFDGLENEMEGKFREGHFNGVGTVVKLLFKIVKPDKAFFGEKDYQQLQIIRKLTTITGLPIEIIGCPIHREASGLARSSRNERLSPQLREQAAIIYKILQQVKKDFGTKSADSINQWVNLQFEKQQFLKLEYFEIANSQSLKRMYEKNDNIQYRAFIAAYAGEIRLIDNIALND